MNGIWVNFALSAIVVVSVLAAGLNATDSRSVRAAFWLTVIGLVAMIVLLWRNT